jgi:hypothetical protein
VPAVSLRHGGRVGTPLIASKAAARCIQGGPRLETQDTAIDANLLPELVGLLIPLAGIAFPLVVCVGVAQLLALALDAAGVLVAAVLLRLGGSLPMSLQPPQVAALVFACAPAAWALAASVTSGD